MFGVEQHPRSKPAPATISAATGLASVLHKPICGWPARERGFQRVHGQFCAHAGPRRPGVDVKHSSRLSPASSTTCRRDSIDDVLDSGHGPPRFSGDGRLAIRQHGVRRNRRPAAGGRSPPADAIRCAFTPSVRTRTTPAFKSRRRESTRASRTRQRILAFARGMRHGHRSRTARFELQAATAAVSSTGRSNATFAVTAAACRTWDPKRFTSTSIR